MLVTPLFNTQHTVHLHLSPNADPGIRAQANTTYSKSPQRRRVPMQYRQQHIRTYPLYTERCCFLAAFSLRRRVAEVLGIRTDFLVLAKSIELSNAFTKIGTYTAVRRGSSPICPGSPPKTS